MERPIVEIPEGFNDQIPGHIQPRLYPLALVEAVWGELLKHVRLENRIDEAGVRAAMCMLAIFEEGFGLPKTEKL